MEELIMAVANEQENLTELLRQYNVHYGRIRYYIDFSKIEKNGEIDTYNYTIYQNTGTEYYPLLIKCDIMRKYIDEDICIIKFYSDIERLKQLGIVEFNYDSYLYAVSLNRIKLDVRVKSDNNELLQVIHSEVFEYDKSSNGILTTIMYDDNKNPFSFDIELRFEVNCDEYKKGLKKQLNIFKDER